MNKKSDDVDDGKANLRAEHVGELSSRFALFALETNEYILSM